MTRSSLAPLDETARPVALQGDDDPNRLHNAERPRPGEEPIGAREYASTGEREDESRAATLKCVHQHHERQGCYAEGGEHADSLD